MFSIFLAKEEIDSVEGKAGMRTIAAFSDRAAATFAAYRKGVMGDNGEVQEVMVYESFVEFKTDQKENLRRQALAKLTDEERAILGL